MADERDADPAARAAGEPGDEREALEAEFWGRAERERIHVQSLHRQWAEARRVTPVEHKPRARKRGRVGSETAALLPIGRSPRGSRRSKRKSGGEGSPRLLAPLSAEAARLGTADTLASTTTGCSSRVSTPFTRHSVVVSQDNPRMLQSFLANFLEDDLGSFKKHIDLTQHARDSNAPITDATLQELADLHPHVQGIDIRFCNEVTDVGLWALARNCMMLASVNFEGCTKITHIGLRSLALRCNSLRTLVLKNCTHTNDLGLRVLAAGCPLLRYVSLEGCSAVTDGGMSELFKCCRELELLNLKGCAKLSEFGDRALVQLGQTCGRLRDLDLTDCEHVRDAGVRAVARGCPRLRALRCSGCKALTGAIVHALGRGCPELVTLSLGECKEIGNRDVWELAETLPELKSLSLRGLPKLHASGIRGLCEWADKIESLNLSGCVEVDNECLTMMGNMLKKLKRIDLSGLGQISGKGVRDLCHGCPRLIHVDLSSCRKVSRRFLEDLCKDLPFVQVARDRVALVPRPNAQQLIRETERMRVHHAAAVVIQRLVRGVRARGGAKLIRHYALRRFVVPKLQALWRGYYVRKCNRERREREEQTRAARLLQRMYRGHKGRERAARARRIREIRANESVAALRIQAVFRGWQDRKRVAVIRRRRALAAVEMQELREREELMAKYIQRTWRGRKGRLTYLAALEVKLARERQAFAEKMAAIKMQAIWRSRDAYKERRRRMAAKIRRELEEQSAQDIQRVFRGMRGRRVAAAARKTKQWKLEQSSAMVMQRAWRGCRGRHIAALMHSFAKLQGRETAAATKLQGWWRGVRSKQVIAFLKLAQQQQARRVAAAIMVQRVFRGHKGREEREVRLELRGVEARLAPLRAEEARLEKLKAEAEGELQRTVEHAESLQTRIMELNTELVEVSKHKSKWYDSANVTGTLQRYRTTYLAQALRGKMEDLRAQLGKVQKKTIDELETSIRSLDRQLRDLRKEMAPELNLEFFVRQNRANRIRASLAARSQAVCVIQRCFRGYRAQLATALGGAHWQECFDEATGAAFYFNVQTQERALEAPWAFRVLADHAERERERAAAEASSSDLASRMRAAVQEARRSSQWAEFWDESTGHAYYYNSLTGEYRWEMPPEYARRLAEQQQDSAWLKHQDVAQLTARSARLRDVPSGWIEYQDRTGSVYYFNAMSQETQWEQPPGFEAEWVAAQDAAALTSRSSKVRALEHWAEYRDEGGHVYYYNAETGEAVWSKPEGFDEQWLAANEEALTARSVRGKELGSRWQELVDPETGYSYYYDTVTGETRWSLSPRTLAATLTATAAADGEANEAEAEAEAEAEEGGDGHENARTAGEDADVSAGEYWQGSISPLAPAHSISVGSAGHGSWQEMLDTESNAVYYWNSESGESVATLEEALAGGSHHSGGSGALQYRAEEHLSEEEVQAQRDRDPTTFTTAERLQAVLGYNLSFDEELEGKVSELVGLERERHEVVELAEYGECIQWAAQYLLGGELLSAAGVVEHALSLARADAAEHEGEDDAFATTDWDAAPEY